VFSSIRWRLAASYVLLILLSISLMGSLALYIVQGYVGKQESAYLRANAEETADLAQRFMNPRIRQTALEELAATSAFLGDARVRIMDAERTVLADSGDPGRPDDFLWLAPSSLSEQPPDTTVERGDSLPIIIPIPSQNRGNRLLSRELMPLLRNFAFGTNYVYARRIPTPWGRRFVFETGRDANAQPDEPRILRSAILSITLPVGTGDALLGWVEMSSPLSLSAELLAPVRTAVLASGLGALLVAAVVGFLIGRTISNPLRSLAATARQMGSGDLSARAASRRKDEIGDLARQLNGMAESLETSFRDLRAERDSLKRFVADASHELRTPITALATFNELLQGSASEDPAARQEFLRESQTQLEKLQWITANLLDLSRLEAGIAGLAMGSHMAADIVETAVAVSRPRAREKGIALAVRQEAAFPVNCDRQRMEMALSNLVTNAVKFTQPGGEVAVSAAADKDRALFVVADNGPGIPPEDLPLIFDRFYRGRSSTAEGSGLGLAIVQSVAHAHGGKVEVRSEPGAGSTFTLTIPLGAPKAAQI
jgi:signal transduction histidine kinase